MCAEATAALLCIGWRGESPRLWRVLKDEQTPTLRMLTAGEDPLYIARRCIVMASEDIGLANDRALPMAIAAYNACQIIGMPECRINLAHLVAYLAESPKSTRSYEAYNRVRVFMPRYIGYR